MASLFDTATEPAAPARASRTAREHGHRLVYHVGRTMADARWTCSRCGQSLPARGCFRSVDCIDD